MIKDKNSSNDIYKNYAFVEFFDLEDAKKALLALGKGEIKLREETLSGNYSTKKTIPWLNMEFIEYVDILVISDFSYGLLELKLCV